MPPPDDLDALTAEIRTLVPTLDALGLEVVEARPGRVAARIPAEPNANHFGVVYAGSLFSVAEMLGGLIARTTFPLPGFVPVIKRAEIAYHRPATSSVRADASLPEEEHVRVPTEAHERGKADYALTVEVTDEQGEPVATLTADYQLRRG